MINPLSKQLLAPRLVEASHVLTTSPLTGSAGAAAAEATRATRAKMKERMPKFDRLVFGWSS